MKLLKPWLLLICSYYYLVWWKKVMTSRPLQQDTATNIMLYYLRQLIKLVLRINLQQLLHSNEVWQLFWVKMHSYKIYICTMFDTILHPYKLWELSDNVSYILCKHTLSFMMLYMFCSNVPISCSIMCFLLLIYFR